MPLIYRAGLHDMADKELVSTAKELFESIYTIDCYSTSDLMRYEIICRELSRRGYKLDEVKHLVVHK